MSLISTAARHSFEQLFGQALRAHLRGQADDEVSVLPTSALSGRADQPSPLILLTTASLRYKLVAMFRIVDEAGVRACFGGEGAAGHLEALNECGNLCCGAMNRELLHYSPHMGLSTPSLLHTAPTKALAGLQAEHVSHFAIHINGMHLLDASLCMRGNAKVDFVVNTQPASAETGELELL